MKKILIIFAANIIFYFSAMSQELVEPNGYWWAEQANSILKSNQVSYLYGLLDGINLGHYISLRGFNNPNSLCVQKGLESFEQSRILDTIPVMFIQDKMNEFYRDTTNLFVTCSHAFWIAAYKLAKKEPEQIKAMIEMYKKEDRIEDKK
jgi:hypothetical protein